MFKKYYIAFKNIKPIDAVVFIGVNILVGMYIWSPFFKDVYKKPEQIEQIDKSNIQTISLQSENDSKN